MNDLPVGRSVDETLRLVQAFQYTDLHGEVCPAGWKPGQDTVSLPFSFFLKKLPLPQLYGSTSLCHDPKLMKYLIGNRHMGKPEVSANVCT